MADDAGGGVSQRAAAMAAFSKKANEREEEKEFTPSSQLSAREKAMQNLNKKGVVSSREARGATGASQHGQAIKNLGIQDEGVKVVPNWKLTAAQKNAAAARAEIKGSANHLEATAKFGVQKSSTAGQLPTTFVPVSKTHVSSGSGLTPRTSLTGGVTGGGTPRSSFSSGTVAAPVAPSPRASLGNATAEAAEGVEKDLELLVAAFPRLGTKKADGSIHTTFGKVMDDEKLEQQLESLVGTLKAGRKRGLLLWEGQMLLKGAHDDVPIVLKGAGKPEEAKPKEEVKAPEVKAEEPPAEEPKEEEPAKADDECKAEGDGKAEAEAVELS